MKHLILISLLFSVNLAFAQFAVIKGENDVNVRTEANPESEIIRNRSSMRNVFSASHCIDGQ